MRCCTIPTNLEGCAQAREERLGALAEVPLHQHRLLSAGEQLDSDGHGHDHGDRDVDGDGDGATVMVTV